MADGGPIKPDALAERVKDYEERGYEQQTAIKRTVEEVLDGQIARETAG